MATPESKIIGRIKNNMVPQGNWMRLLMCDGKAFRRWGTYFFLFLLQKSSPEKIFLKALNKKYF
jgi:hypothetical protein